jgi:heme/copper-type cytochrome/quinol oxidase subunit 2
MSPRLPKILLAAALLVALQPLPLRACAACYGQSDSPMAQGMNWGIFTLLGVIAVVLSGVTGFFVYLAKRSAGAEPEPAAPPTESAPEE